MRRVSKVVIERVIERVIGKVIEKHLRVKVKVVSRSRMARNGGGR